MKLEFKRDHLIGLLIPLAVAMLLIILFTQTKIFEAMERGSIDFRFWLRDPSERSEKLQEGVRQHKINPRARKDIVILGIDENTIRYFSDRGIQWPFPWNIHAKFTEYIGTGNPAAIFFDIMFLDHKEYEDDLAEAIEKSGVCFLDYPFETEEVGTKYEDQDQRIRLLNRVRFPVARDDTTPPIVEEPVPPTPKLTRAAEGIGFANVFPGTDNINRTVPLLLKYQGYYYPNIDLILLMHWYGITKEDVEIEIGEYIKLKNVPKEKMAKPNDEREIIIPIDKHGFMDINFIGGFGSFTHYPYSLFHRKGDLMEEGNTSLENKIVLVAAYAATGIATDEKQSPYGATFGIEHHANALNTIMNQDFLYRFSDLQNAVLILVIALLIGLVTPRLSIVTSLLYTFGLAVIFIVGAYLLFDLSSVITLFSLPIIQIGLSFTLVITYRVLTEQQEKRYIRQTFSKFVSKSVVDELLKSPEKLKLGGEKKELTVLFSDIRGFTSISEKLSPEELVEHLNVYLQAMTDIVIQSYGTLDKYVGDEIMAFWGAPIPQEEHALLACRAALDMMETLHRMNETWPDYKKMDIGIGINTGEMVVGNMGSAARMDYTLMGDNVNLGARLEGTNKVYRTNIIISENTYAHVKDHVIVRELDLIRVKGKELPVTIYELIAMKD